MRLIIQRVTRLDISKKKQIKKEKGKKSANFIDKWQWPLRFIRLDDKNNRSNLITSTNYIITWIAEETEEKACSPITYPAPRHSEHVAGSVDVDFPIVWFLLVTIERSTRLDECHGCVEHRLIHHVVFRCAGGRDHSHLRRSTRGIPS